MSISLFTAAPLKLCHIQHGGCTDVLLRRVYVDMCDAEATCPGNVFNAERS